MESQHLSLGFRNYNYHWGFSLEQLSVPYVGYLLGTPEHLAVELGLFAYLFLLSVWITRGQKLQERTQKLSRFFGQDPWIPGVVLVGLTLAGCLVLGVTLEHTARVHDEFSYLFAAETFLQGKVSNEPHKLWQFFEAMHVLPVPATVSKYPPAQGLFLAIGKLIGGEYFIGVALSAGLAIGSIFWLLISWVPVSWAFAISFFAMVRYAFFTYWGVSFWGGFVAVAGGALLLGCAQRLTTSVKYRDLVLGIAGLALLATSRPFQGLILAICVGAVYGVAIYKKRYPKFMIRRIFLTVSIGGSLILGGLAAYNYAATGDPLALPYMLYEKMYNTSTQFAWGEPKPSPGYNHRVYDLMWEPGGFERKIFAFAHEHPFWHLVQKFYGYWTFYLGPACTVVVFGLSILWRQICQRFLFLIAFGCLVGESLVLPSNPHYVAPFASLFLVFMALSAMKIYQLRAGKYNWGAALVLAAPLAMTTALLYSYGKKVIPAEKQNRIRAWQMFPPPGPVWPQRRDQIISSLQSRGGKHLIIVEYNDTVYHEGWVNNPPSIDSSNVVWAHSMGVERNSELINYFSDRDVWRVKFKGYHPTFESYSAEASVK